MPIVSVNPATGEELARFQEHTWEEVDVALQNAWDARAPWRDAGFGARSARFTDLAAYLRQEKARLAAIPGSVPDPFSIPSGCSFYPRCSAPKKPGCQGPESVPLTEVRPQHWVRCTLYQ